MFPYCVSQKKPCGFLTFFPNGWEFLVHILHAYYKTYVPIYARLQIKFLFNYQQLWRSCAIYRDHPVHIICSASKCPPSAETHTFKRLRKSLIALLIVVQNFPKSPCSPGRWPLGYEERRCWANCACNSFRRHRETGGRTDRRTDRRQCHAIAIPRFALYRAVKRFLYLVNRPNKWESSFLTAPAHKRPFSPLKVLSKSSNVEEMRKGKIDKIYL